MKHRLPLSVLLGASLAVFGCTAARRPKVEASTPSHITLTIALVRAGPIVSGSAMDIRCTFSNPSPLPSSILVKHFAADGTALEVPWSAEVKVVDAHGQNVLGPGTLGGWWSVNYLSSEFCIEPDYHSDFEPCIAPGDRITLTSGQVLRRVIRLDRLLVGSPPLQPGRYRIRIRWDGITSQELDLAIVSASGA